MTMAYHRYHGIDTRIVRIFNCYGTRMRPGDGRVVSNFLVQALRGEPLTVYGDGTQTRSFCYVDDEVEGIEHRPLPEDDPQVRQPDISLARRILGWEPKTSLREGLRKTVPYFRKLVEEEDARARVL